MSAKTPAYHFINADLAHARDGEVVLYRRENSKRWQMRFKLNDSKWRRASTKQVNIDYAARVACEAYDKARFLRDENLPLSSKRFDAVAKIATDDMRAQLAGGQGKSVYYSYISAIEKYLVPFFGKHDLNRIDYKLVKAFDAWRAKKMGKEPVASTVTNHTCGFNRVYDTGIERGWINKLQVPKMANKGAASVARPAFSANEYLRLTSYMAKWATKGHAAKTREMRELLRDYVLILANTGIRHGTEAQSIKWKGIEWVTIGKERYLQVLVDGKTKTRRPIARHNTEDYLKRIQSRFPDLAKYDFDALLKKKLDVPLFRLRSGEQTNNLHGTFRQLMRDSGLEKDATGRQNRTLYSLRHTYAHFALLSGQMDVYTLATQMGTSVKMIEAHYGHLQPAMKAKMIAGPKMGKHREQGA